MVTPRATVTAAPSHTLRPMRIEAGTMSARESGPTWWWGVVSVLPCPDRTVGLAIGEKCLLPVRRTAWRQSLGAEATA
jgi:hypothetical protein